MLGDGTVFKVDEELCIVVTALDADFDHFTALNGDLDVEIVAVTELMPQIGVNGPRARDALQSMCSADLGSLRYFHHWVDPVQIGGVPCSVSRTGYSGELGFEISAPPTMRQSSGPPWWAPVFAPTAWPRLRRCGSSPG